MKKKSLFPLTKVKNPEPKKKDENWINLSSGYIERSKDIFPKQGKEKPWKNNENFIKDIFQIRYGDLKDDDMKFS